MRRYTVSKKKDHHGPTGDQEQLISYSEHLVVASFLALIPNINVTTFHKIKQHIMKTTQLAQKFSQSSVQQHLPWYYHLGGNHLTIYNKN